MTKTELIKRLCNKRPGLANTTASKVVDSILEQMSDSISRARRIEIRGFGSFFTKKYENARIWNPKTREKLASTTKIRIKFKVSKLIIKRLTSKAFNYIL